MPINEINIDVSARGDALKGAASCLQEYLKLHEGSGRHYRVLAFMASETIKRIEQSKPTEFNNLDLQEAVLGRIGDDASAWLSPIWKKITTGLLPSIQDSLEGFAIAKDYTVYPWVGKTESAGGSGNVALYFLTAREVTSEERVYGELLPTADIHYLPAVKITPSWWAKWLFDQNYSANGWRKLLYILTPMIWVIAIILFADILWILLSRIKPPLTPQDVILLLTVIGALFYCRYVFRRLWAFMEDRIMLAPNHLVSIGEFGVCVELHKENFKDKSSPRILRLVKYLAECPICGAEVLIDKGEPDFPRRLIGRCQESPMEHIFSFDRITKTGNKLRKY